MVDAPHHPGVETKRDNNGFCTGSNPVLTTQKTNKMIIVNKRRFYIWKLELWWVAFNKVEFHPEDRKHLIGNWFWRT